MYKLVRESKMPKVLKWLINILLTLTCVYWIGYFIYKILESVRRFVHWTTEKRNWWTFLMCILILCVGILLAAQFYFELDPIGKITNYFIEKWNGWREYLANLIMS